VLKNAPHIIVRRRRAESHAAHHGGAWKVAYADFVTAMMAFFMVMLLVNQDPSVKKAIAGYFRDPGAFPTQKSDGVLDGAKTGVGGEPAQPQAPSHPSAGAIGSEQKSFSEAEDRIKGALQGAGDRRVARSVEMSITPRACASSRGSRRARASSPAGVRCCSDRVRKFRHRRDRDREARQRRDHRGPYRQSAVFAGCEDGN
jgi:flagellar motor protein MotB